MKFKVLRGLHNEGNKIYGPDQKDGDVVDSKVDLTTLHNHPGSIRFQRLDESHIDPETAEEEKAVAHVVRKVEATSQSDDGLDRLTVAELKRMAEELELDLRGATKKDAVIKAIRSAT